MKEVIKQTENKVYFSDDGEQFCSEEECLEYERWCELDEIIKSYTDKGVNKCMYSIDPMSDRIAILLDLYNKWQKDWYCYRPLNEEDIDFIKKWLEYKSLDDRKNFSSGYSIHNKIENFEIDKPYIIVNLLDDIYVTSYEEISDKIHNIIEEDLSRLNRDIDHADWFHFSERRRENRKRNPTEFH